MWIIIIEVGEFDVLWIQICLKKSMSRGVTHSLAPDGHGPRNIECKQTKKSTKDGAFIRMSKDEAQCAIFHRFAWTISH